VLSASGRSVKDGAGISLDAPGADAQTATGGRASSGFSPRLVVAIPPAALALEGDGFAKLGRLGLT